MGSPWEVPVSFCKPRKKFTSSVPSPSGSWPRPGGIMQWLGAQPVSRVAWVRLRPVPLPETRESDVNVSLSVTWLQYPSASHRVDRRGKR